MDKLNMKRGLAINKKITLHADESFGLLLIQLWNSIIASIITTPVIIEISMALFFSLNFKNKHLPMNVRL